MRRWLAAALLVPALALAGAERSARAQQAPDAGPETSADAARAEPPPPAEPPSNAKKQKPPAAKAPDAGTGIELGDQSEPTTPAGGEDSAGAGTAAGTGAGTAAGTAAGTGAAAAAGTGGETAPGTETAPGGDHGVPPIATTLEAPPISWTDWDIEFVNGKGYESKEMVKAFLSQRMESDKTLNATEQAELAAFCQKRLGYHLLEIRSEKRSEGGTRAVLRLEPVDLVYWIEVDVENWKLRWLFTKGLFTFLKEFSSSVFADEIRRRMRLRPGAPLPRERQTRRLALREERRRVASFLRGEGFFDAQVEIREKPHGENSVMLVVEVHKGTRYAVGHIEVVGNHAIETSTIVEKFHHPWVCLFTSYTCILQRGFSRQQLRKDVDAVAQLYRKRGYPGVRVRTDFDMRHSFKRDSGTVEFTIFINERRKIDVVFEGNNKRSTPDEDLEQVLTFAKEGSYDDVEVVASAEALRSYYQSKGHFEANVSWQRERFGGVFERIVFTIDEGPKLKVEKVSFEGNKQISDSELASVIKTKVYSRIALFRGRGGYTTSLQIQQDVNRIASLYEKKGFYHAEVRARVARDPRVQGNAAALAAAIAGEVPADGLYVRFLIDERQPLVVEAVRFDFVDAHGKPLPPDAPHQREKDLRKVVSLRAGHAYNKKQEEKDRDKLSRLYYRRGHPHAVVKSTAVDGSTPNEKVIVHTIFENHEVRFGQVAIRGNFKTDNWVVRDELGYHDGDLLTLGRAERGQQNLRSSGLFKAVNVDFIDFEPERNQDHINVVVRVQERESRMRELAFGYSNDRGAITDVKWSRMNLWGVGMRFDFHGLIGTESPGKPFGGSAPPLDSAFLEAKLVAPRWIARRATRGIARHAFGIDDADGWGFSTETAGFYRLETTERFGKLLSWGGSLAFSRAGQYGFFQGWLFSLRYDFRRRSRDVELVRPAGPSDDITKAPVTTDTGAIGPVLIIDKRTDAKGRPQPLSPDRGFKVELRAKFADRFLLADDRFVKLGAAVQQFWRPGGWKRLLLTSGLRYDHGIPLGGEFLLPEVERYFAGGDTTVRGFEEDRLATEIIEEPMPPLGDITQIRVIPSGGNIRAIANFDLQLQVWDLWSIPVVSAVFWDIGLVTNSLDNLKLGDERHAIGVALFRLAAPFGSVSVEYAVPLDPGIGDDPRGRFHFNIGLLF